MKDVGKKKLLMIAGAIVGLLVLIIIILLIFHAITGEKKLSYSEIEDKVLTAAKKYYNENKNALPENDGEQVVISDNTLTSAGYLKEMSKLTNKTGSTCSANVYVTNINSEYRYTVKLDCGKDYSKKTLSEYIKENVEKVYSGDGLYELNGELVYRGDTPNNYIKIDKRLYRIVKITDDKVTIIVDSDRITTKTWDDRYNIEKDSEYGINDFTISRIKEENNVQNIYN